MFVHSDHEGSNSVVTNTSGSVVERTSYGPYGDILSGGTAIRYGYESKEHQQSLGDMDFHARRYDPDIGIFTQPDILIQSVYLPQGLNRYMFENNNPYKYIDPDGRTPALAYVFSIVTLSGASVYWIFTPIDYSDSNWRSTRLLKGLGHGINWGVQSTLAMASGGMSYASGTLRYTGTTARSISISGLSTASIQLYDAIIENQKIDPVDMIISIGANVLTSGLGPNFGGQYAPNRNAISKQTAKMVYDFYIKAAAEIGIDKTVNILKGAFKGKNNPISRSRGPNTGTIIKDSESTTKIYDKPIK